MSYAPFKLPAGADTASNFVVYRTQVALTATGVFPIAVVDDQLGPFVVTEVRFHVDANGGSELTTYTASIGWNASSYDNVAASATKGTTQTGSTYFGLRLKQYKVDAFTLRTASGYYPAFATPGGASTAINLNITATGMGAGSQATFFVVGYYAGARP